MATTEFLASDQRNGTDRSDPETGARLGPRRRLPTGRAVVGGLLVVLAALGVLWSLTRADGQATTEYLVLAHDIQAGDIVDLDDFDIVDMVLPESVDAFTLYRNSTQDTAPPRWVARTPIRAGALALVDDYTQIDGGEVPQEDGWSVTVHVDEARAINGLATANLVVDVVSTFEESSATRSEVVARGAEIVQVGPTAHDEATLAVRLRVGSYQTVLDVITANAAGALTLVDTTDNPPPSDIVAGRSPGAPDGQSPSGDESVEVD